VVGPVREMLISHDLNETRVAIVEGGDLVEFYVERSRRSVVGNVYLGKVKDVLSGMEAAFVDIGLEKNAFLYVDEVVTTEGLTGVPKRDIASLLHPGQQIMVQVLKDPMGTKGARITTEITLPGRFVVLMPFTDFVGVSRKLSKNERERLSDIIHEMAPKGVGMIVRTAAAEMGQKDIQGDVDFLMRLWKRVNHQAHEGLAPEVVYTEMDLALRMVRDVFGESFDRLVVDDRQLQDKITSFLKKTSSQMLRRVVHHKERIPLFDYYRIEPQIDAALLRRVRLPSGGYIVIDRTEALTAIDVNTGKFVGKRSLEDTIVRTNLEAATEVVRQLRLRDIGGIIVIDFIDMDKAENRDRLSKRFAQAIAVDRAKTRVMDISPLGLVEMTRKNVADGPFTVLTDECSTCRGEGRVLSDSSVRIMVERKIRSILCTGRADGYLLGVSAETYALLAEPGRNLTAMLRAETGKHVSLTVDRDVNATEVRIVMEGRVSDRKKGS